MRLGTPGTGDPTTPAVLEAHLLPGLIGSSVYVLGAVGPSDTAWPYFPLGGAVVTDHSELTILTMGDDQAYWFDRGEVISWDDAAFDYAHVDGPEDLIDRVIHTAADALAIAPWDAAAVGEFLDACDGYPHFDQFMALPEASFAGRP